ncbi:MAG: hypothetical protein AAGK17_07460 [Pseudomonadota bacterium]
MPDPHFENSIAAVASAMELSQDPWWIIGSAAVVLHGSDPGTIADIDVMISERDLKALYMRLPLSNTPEVGKPMFRSDLFGRWSEPKLEVEFMAGLRLREAGEWHPIKPKTRVAFPVGKQILFAPEKAELVNILLRFGREKDCLRAASLENM